MLEFLVWEARAEIHRSERFTGIRRRTWKYCMFHIKCSGLSSSVGSTEAYVSFLWRWSWFQHYPFTLGNRNPLCQELWSLSDFNSLWVLSQTKSFLAWSLTFFSDRFSILSSDDDVMLEALTKEQKRGIFHKVWSCFSNRKPIWDVFLNLKIKLSEIVLNWFFSGGLKSQLLFRLDTLA